MAQVRQILSYNSTIFNLVLTVLNSVRVLVLRNSYALELWQNKLFIVYLIFHRPVVV